MGRFQGGKGINPGECGDRLLTDDDAELTLSLWSASEQIWEISAVEIQNQTPARQS